MAWEGRGSGYYYYKKKRVGKRVRSDYVGSGPIAELTAACDQISRDLLLLDREEKRSLVRRYDAARTATGELCDVVELLVELILVSIGFHRRRGEWRRSRLSHVESPLPADRSTPTTTNLMGQPMSQKPTDITAELIDDALSEAKLLRAAIDAARSSGDSTLYNRRLQELQRALTDHPTAWATSENHSTAVAHQVAQRLACDAPRVQEAMIAGMKQLQASLGRDESPILERLLIDQIALAWTEAEGTRIAWETAAYEKDDDTGELEREWAKRKSSAEARYRRSIESLARVRKLVGSTKPVQNAYRSIQLGAERTLSERAAQPQDPEAPSTTAPDTSPTPEDNDADSHEGEGAALFRKRAAEVGMDPEMIEMWLSMLVPE